MFSGGEYEEVARWLRNFVASHAKRENLRAEPVVDTEGPREGQSFGVRLRLGAGLHPAPPAPPLELGFPEVAQNRGSYGRRRLGQDAVMSFEETGALDFTKRC